MNDVPEKVYEGGSKGNYYCTCSICKLHFIGHKRDFICPRPHTEEDEPRESFSLMSGKDFIKSCDQVWANVAAEENRLRDEKMQTAIKYAHDVINTNEECFVAQWVLQNQDKQIDDYTMCYQYCGDVIKFWMEEVMQKNPEDLSLNPVCYYYKDPDTGMEMSFSKYSGWGWGVCFPKSSIEEAIEYDGVIPWPELSAEEQAVVDENYENLHRMIREESDEQGI